MKHFTLALICFATWFSPLRATEYRMIYVNSGKAEQDVLTWGALNATVAALNTGAATGDHYTLEQTSTIAEASKNTENHPSDQEVIVVLHGEEDSAGNLTGKVSDMDGGHPPGDLGFASKSFYCGMDGDGKKITNNDVGKRLADADGGKYKSVGDGVIFDSTNPDEIGTPSDDSGDDDSGDDDSGDDGSGGDDSGGYDDGGDGGDGGWWDDGE